MIVAKMSAAITTLVLASSLSLSALASSLHGPLTQTVYKEVFYDSQFPVSVVHVPWDATSSGADEVSRQVVRFGKRLQYSPTEYMHRQLEQVRTVHGRAPADNQTLMVHRVKTTRNHSDAVCAIRGDAQWLESASNKPMTLDQQYASLRLLHEAFHCLLLDNEDLYTSLNQHLPGLSLYRYSDIRGQFTTDEERQLATRYYEHIHEVTADVGSVLLALVYMDLDEEGLKALLDRRIRNRDYPTPVASSHIGHHTAFYLKTMRHNITELMNWKAGDLPGLLKRQPLQTALQLAYLMGRDQSFTWHSFNATYF